MDLCEISYTNEHDLLYKATESPLIIKNSWKWLKVLSSLHTATRRDENCRRSSTKRRETLEQLLKFWNVSRGALSVWSITFDEHIGHSLSFKWSSISEPTFRTFTCIYKFLMACNLFFVSYSLLYTSIYHCEEARGSWTDFFKNTNNYFKQAWRKL